MMPMERWRDRAITEVPQAKQFLDDHSVNRALEMLDVMQDDPDWNSEWDYRVQVQFLMQAVRDASAVLP
jgi:hypothetical protein